MDIESFKVLKMKPIPSKLVYGDAGAGLSASFKIDPTGTRVGYADYYNPKGSGRSVLYGDIYSKGVGNTGIVGDNTNFIATGQLAMTEAVNEAIFLEIIASEFPDAVKVHCILETEERVCLHPKMSKEEFEKLIPRKQYSRGAILARDFPTRIAHLATNPDKIKDILQTTTGIKFYETSDYIYSILDNIAKRAGFWWVRRVDFGAVMPDNIDINGNVFDLATATIKPDYRNTYVCKHKHLFWDYVAAYSPSIPIELVNGVNDAPMHRMTPAINFFEKRMEYWHKFYLFDLLGFTDEDKYSLELQAPELFESIAKEIDSIIRIGTDVKPEDPYDGHVELINKQLVGLNWREGLSRIVLGRSTFDSAFNNLSRLFPQVFKYIGWKKVWCDNQRLIHTDISTAFRACSNNEVALYEAIETGRIKEYINSHVAIYKETLGAYQK